MDISNDGLKPHIVIRFLHLPIEKRRLHIVEEGVRVLREAWTLLTVQTLGQSADLKYQAINKLEVLFFLVKEQLTL